MQRLSMLQKTLGMFRVQSKSAFCHQKLLRSVKTAAVGEQIKYSDKITLRNVDINQQTPLVILFGWGNGKLKHLLKYSEIFESKSFTTVCVTTSLVNSLLRTSTVGVEESVKVKEVLDEQMKLNPSRPVILYTFSNGGCAIYHLMIKNMRSDTSYGANIKGTIYDSCPIVPNEATVTTVQNAFRQNLNSFIATILSPVIKLVVLYVLKTDKEVQTFMAGMETSKVTSPNLFLFSRNDILAPYKDILDFIQKRREFGVDVDYQLWDVSKHVGHFQKYPQEYASLVESFVNKCLK